MQVPDTASPEEMWERFIDHLNKTNPLLVKWKVEKGKKVMASFEMHKAFLGSIESYKKVFLEANGDIKSGTSTS